MTTTNVQCEQLTCTMYNNAYHHMGSMMITFYFEYSLSPYTFQKMVHITTGFIYCQQQKNACDWISC